MHAVRENRRPTLTLRPPVQVGDARVGDAVYARDGALGKVERVIKSESSAPAFLVVAVRRLVRRRYPVIPWSSVRAVDRSRNRVYVEGRGVALARLPESLPLVI